MPQSLAQIYPQGALRDPRPWDIAPSGQKSTAAMLPQGALRDPGLWDIAPSGQKSIFATLPRVRFATRVARRK